MGKFPSLERLQDAIATLKVDLLASHVRFVPQSEKQWAIEI